MLSKNSIKYINSLKVKKYRNEEHLFIAEGERLIEELLNSTLQLKTIYYTSEWTLRNKNLNFEVVEITYDEMRKISGLDSSSPVLALVKIPDNELTQNLVSDKLILALDDIQDPGNMGTIIRLADWFGIDYIICSKGTVEVFSPKVVQASMGAISRVKVVYCELPMVLKEYSKTLPIYGTFMEGNNIYNENLASKGIVVMGNEGNGISDEVARLVSNKIHIPSFANNRGNIESLNVAMATAIVCSEFKRRG
jgi:RNA methyltransferase, TrmH family